MSRENSLAEEEVGRSELKIEELLRVYDYPDSEIQRARRVNLPARRHNKSKVASAEAIACLKLPYFNEQLASDVSCVLQHYSSDVRLVHKSGCLSLNMLVMSSFSVAACPRQEQRSRKRGRGLPMACRECDAGLVAGQCLLKGVVCICYVPYTVQGSVHS